MFCQYPVFLQLLIDSNHFEIIYGFLFQISLQLQVGHEVCKGMPLYISGVNAAPIYHSHPHQQKEFDHLDLSVDSQARLTMENLKTVLEAAGSTVRDVVQLIIFIVDIKNNAERIGQIISSYFFDHLPTSTVIGVTELFTDPRLILEITATAYI